MRMVGVVHNALEELLAFAAPGCCLIFALDLYLRLLPSFLSALH